MQEPLHDVVIVGAGPTGMTLAAELHRQGLSPIVLDMRPEGEHTSRACVIHARTLEVLEAIGATPEILRQGLIVPIFRIRDRSHILTTISFKDLKTAYPFTLMCPQDRVETILQNRLQSLGGTVQRPCEVTGIRQEENKVQLHVKSGSDTTTLFAKWVVGCDGSHSLVRQQASIPFEGGSYDETFLLADLEMDWPLGRDEVTLFYSEKGLVVVAPLPGNHFRIVATVPQATHEPVMSDFQSILAERGPEDGSRTIHRIVWASRFYIQHRVAKTLRQGNMLLAGDAAHVHSPAGGQGMNTGIQDAVSLATALNQVLREGDGEALKEWQENRLKIAHSVVELTDRMTKVATLSSPILKRLRNTAVELVGSIPFAQHAFAEKLSELANR